MPAVVSGAGVMGSSIAFVGFGESGGVGSVLGRGLSFSQFALFLLVSSPPVGLKKLFSLPL